MAQDTETVGELRSQRASLAAVDEAQFQAAGFLIQMSLDWIICRASENIDDFIGESHVTLIEEPLSRFVQAHALHEPPDREHRRAIDRPAEFFTRLPA